MLSGPKRYLVFRETNPWSVILMPLTTACRCFAAKGVTLCTLLVEDQKTELLEGNVTRHDSQRRFSVQRKVATTLLRHYFEWLQHRFQGCFELKKIAANRPVQHHLKTKELARTAAHHQ